MSLLKTFLYGCALVVIDCARASNVYNFSWVYTIEAPTDVGMDQWFQAFGEVVSVSGSYLIVGSPFGSTGVSPPQGFAFIFYTASENVWSEYVSLTTPAEPLIGPGFGRCVSIDGNRAIVGDPDAWYQVTIDGNSHDIVTGAIHLYERAEGSDVNSWGHKITLTPVDISLDAGASYDNTSNLAQWDGTKMGVSCDLYDNKIIAATRKCGDESEASCAFIFEYIDGSWQRSEAILPKELDDTGSEFSSFNASVAIGPDFAAFGAPGYDKSVGGVWLYNTSSHQVIDTLEGTDANGTRQFGFACAISQDNHLFASAPNSLIDENHLIGRVWEYNVNIDDAAAEVSSRTGYMADTADGFSNVFAVEKFEDLSGSSVALVGTQNGDANVFVWQRIGGVWVKTDILDRSDLPVDDATNGAYGGEYFGRSVAIGNTGTRQKTAFLGDKGNNKIYVFVAEIDTFEPSSMPILGPTSEPTNLPSSLPTILPSLGPTFVPSAEPVEPSGTQMNVYECLVWFEMEFDKITARDVRQNDSLRSDIEKALQEASVESVDGVSDENDVSVQIQSVVNNNGTRRRLNDDNNGVLLQVLVGLETSDVRDAWIDGIDSVTSEFETSVTASLRDEVSVDVVSVEVVEAEDLISTTRSVGEDEQSQSSGSSEDRSEISDQLVTVYGYVVMGIAGFLGLLTILGVVDRKHNNNERFRVASFVVVFMYVMDFVSDVFFIGQVYFYNETVGLFDVIVSLLALVFVVFPIIQSIIQLQKAIKKWRRDVDNGNNIEAWLAENLRSLYTIVALTGGSTFCAIIIVNSNFFSIPFFDMSLARRQQRVFRNKRVFSVVLLENVPQLVLQAAFSIRYQDWAPITIFATIFSLISIFVTLFEFYTQRMLISSETHIVLKFTVESKHVSLLSFSEFKTEVQNARTELQRHIAKIVGINPETIELLKPVQVKNGAALTFIIQSETLDAAQVKQAILEEVETNHLVAVLRKSWKLDERKIRDTMNITSVETKTMHPELDGLGKRRESVGATIVMSTRMTSKSTGNDSALLTTTTTNAPGTAIAGTASTGGTAGAATRIPSASIGMEPLPGVPTVGGGAGGAAAAAGAGAGAPAAYSGAELHDRDDELYGGEGGPAGGEGVEGAVNVTGEGGGTSNGGVPRPNGTPFAE